MERWLANPTLLRADADADYARRDRDRPGADHRAAPRLPQRSRRRPAPVGGRRRADRRGVHRIVHDQHRPLPAPPGTCWPARPARCRPGCGSRRRPRWTRPSCGEEGYYSIFARGRRPHRDPGLLAVHGQPGPGAHGATVVSTSTRNFPNRMGTDAHVFLGSAELAAVAAASRARCQSVEEYLDPARDSTPWPPTSTGTSNSTGTPRRRLS